jgi:uncharacterized MAPEG superfamily protein
LAAKKQRGERWVGNPRPSEARVAGVAVRQAHADPFAAHVMPVIEAIRAAAGVTTLKGIAAALNARGVHTVRGGQWHPTQVKRILARQI